MVLSGDIPANFSTRRVESGANIAPTPQLHTPAGAPFGNQSCSELSAPVQDSILTDPSSFLGSNQRLGPSGASWLDEPTHISLIRYVTPNETQCGGQSCRMSRTAKNE